MTRTHLKADLVTTGQIAQPPIARACTDRTFGLPVMLHTAYFGLFFAFLAVMWVGFASPGLTIPMVVFLVFTAAFFIVPMKWATMEPANDSKAMSLQSLIDEGIDTLTGHCSGGAAVAQVLVLPVLILAWGIAAVTIARLV